MGRKKGGAKSKLARMSEEERARYLQRRAEIEEETKRRKQQLISLYMKNKLKREEAFSRLNLAKINEEWRSILRQIKCQELKNELIQVEKLFKESLEQKNRIIRRLLNDLDEAEDLYSTLQQSHMQDVERLIGIQQKRMQYLKDWFCKERESILNEWKEDYNKFKEARNKSQVELECVYYGLKDYARDRAETLEDDHQIKLDDLRSSMAIKLEQITKSREELLEQLWHEYQNILNDYIKYTETFYSHYCELKERDNENTKLIRTHCYDIAKATEQIADLKLEAETVEEEQKFQTAYLEKFRNELNDRFLQMKKDLEARIISDDEQFRFLAVNSHNAVKFLERIAKKGESLLQLVTACRKHESEREKVLPFGFNKQQMLERSLDTLKEPPDEFKEDTIGRWLTLENFWIRVNNVKLDVACLKEEKSLLEQENAQLKTKLKDYLMSITLNSGNNAKAEDYLQRRPQSMKIEKVVHIDLNTGERFASSSSSSKGKNNNQIKKRRPVTCVEGNLSNAIRSAKLVEGKLKTAKIRTIVNW